MPHANWNEYTRHLVQLWDIRTPQTVCIPKGEIELTTLKEINTQLRNLGLMGVPLEEGHEPSTWTHWLIAHGPICGTWPKRYAKWVRCQYGREYDPATLGKVGSIVGAHVESFHSRTVDLTDRLDWNAGDFGDEGSCYWGDRSHARDILEYHDALALRYYDEANHHQGVARCWLSTHRPEGLIAWNAYGTVRLVTSARLLATTLGLSYTHIDLHNNGRATGTVYINAGGYLIAPEEITDKVTALDLSMDGENAPWEYENNEQESCSHCGNERDREDMRDFDGDYYCERCYELLFRYCDGCEEAYSHNDLITLNYLTNAGSHQIEEVCQHCLDTRYDYYQCIECNQTWKGTGDTDEDGDPYCPTCWQEHEMQREADEAEAEATATPEANPEPALETERGVWTSPEATAP